MTSRRSADPVTANDHARGRADAVVTLVQYGDNECPYTRLSRHAVQQLQREFPEYLRFVFRHFPQEGIHTHALLAAEVAECAGAQGKFWAMHDMLFEHQDALQPTDLVRYAEQLELDVERFTQHLAKSAGAARIADDVEGADLSGVSGTPTFFINGRRHHGAYDIGTLSRAVRAAGARATLAAS